MSDESLIQEFYEAAIESFADDDIDAVREALRNLLAIAPDDRRTLEVEGDLAMSQADLDRAERYYKKMAAACDEPETQALSLLSRGIIRIQQDQPAEAFEFLRESSRIFSETDDRAQWLGALHALGPVCVELGHLQEAVDVFQQALSLAIQDADENPDDDSSRYMIAYLRRELGVVMRMLGNLDAAEEQFNLSLTEFVELEDAIDEANTLDCLSTVYQVQGRYQEAEALLLRAIELHTLHEDEEGLSVNYGNMAFLHKHRKEFDKAEVYLRKALEIDQATGRLDGIADFHIQMGELLYQRDDWEQAENHLLTAVKLHKQINNVVGIGAARSNLGVLYRLQGDFKRSEQMTLKALQMAEEMEQTDFIATSLDELATLRKAQGRTDEAKALWKRSLAIFEELRSSRMIEEVKEQLASL